MSSREQTGLDLDRREKGLQEVLSEESSLVVKLQLAAVLPPAGLLVPTVPRLRDGCGLGLVSGAQAA